MKTLLKFLHKNVQSIQKNKCCKPCASVKICFCLCMENHNIAQVRIFLYQGALSIAREIQIEVRVCQVSSYELGIVESGF